MPFHNTKIRKQMEKIYRQVPIGDNHAGTIGMYFTSNGEVKFGIVYLEQSTCLWRCTLFNDQTYVTHTLEEYTLESIQDKRELTSTFLVNSIRLLDEQGARHLVKELCERFHLLPSDEDIDKATVQYDAFNHSDTISESFENGAKWALNTLKGEKR